jgi:hypothetical protein
MSTQNSTSQNAKHHDGGPSFSPRLILSGAVIAGILLALAVHMFAQRFGLDLGGLWRTDSATAMSASSAIAWWLIASVAFVGGFTTATLMHSAAEGQMSRPMRQLLIAVLVLVLASAGQAASAPGAAPSLAGFASGVAALVLGGAMAFCGAYFAFRRA